MFILYGLAWRPRRRADPRRSAGGVATLRLRWIPLVVAGVFVQVILFSAPVSERVGSLGPILYVGSTALVLVAVLRNSGFRALLVVAAGGACNLAAIVANGGFMPASPGALAAIGRAMSSTYSNSAVVVAPGPRAAHRHLLPAPVDPVQQRLQRRRRPDRRGRRGRHRVGDARLARDGAHLGFLNPGGARHTGDWSSGKTPTGSYRASRRLRIFTPRTTNVHRCRLARGKPAARRGRKARDLDRRPMRPETARLPCRWRRATKEQCCESDPGTLHRGGDGPGSAGAHARRRYPVGGDGVWRPD